MSIYNVTLTFRNRKFLGGTNDRAIHCPVSAENAKKAIQKARLLCNKAGYSSRIVREQIESM